MNLSIKRISLLSLLGISLFAACKKQEYESIEELDAASIEAYIQANNLSVQPLGNTGMYYQILEEGKGNDIDYTGQYALVYTVRSLDGVYSVTDTFATASRYFDYLGYFLGASPQGSAIAGNPNYQGQIEKEEGLKMAIRTMLKKTDGQIRVLIPSRLLSYGRNGNTDLGIPPNASMDYVIRVIDSTSMPAYEDASIKSYLQRNDLTNFEQTEAGVYYKITEQGTGDSITVDSTVNVNFKLRLFNGSEVTSSDSLSYAPANWTDAWKTVLPKVRKGGTVTIVSPSASTYGMVGASVGVGSSSITIPPFSSVLYELKLNDKK